MTITENVKLTFRYPPRPGPKKNENNFYILTQQVLIILYLYLTCKLVN